MAKDKKKTNERDTSVQSGVVVEESGKKKKNKKGCLSLFLVFFVVLLVGLFGLSYAFNWFNVRQGILDVLITGDELYAQKMMELDKEKQKAGESQQLADDAKGQYEQKLSELDSRESAVQQREAQLAKLEDEAQNGQTPSDRRAQFVAMFENMDRASAAKAMEQMNDVDAVAGILSAMKQKAAAEVMEQFTPELAAEVAKRMLG